MAIDRFDVSRAVELGKTIAVAYQLYDVAEDNRADFATNALPGDYQLQSQIYANDSLFDPATPQSRRDALAKSLDGLFNTEKPIGLIAVSMQKNDIIVAFRGTQNGFEWFHDGDLQKTKFAIADPSGQDVCMGSTEYGITSLYFSCTTGKTDKSPRLIDTLQELVKGKTLTITGHSLGGAMAALLAMHAAVTLKGIPNSVSALTFASPLIGDKNFAGQFDTLIPDSWRVVNRPDIVPTLPPMFAGYAHVASEYPVNSDHLTKHCLSCWHDLETYLYLLDNTNLLHPECCP
ncbi:MULTISPECIES: alpha/beta fold hydrolase [Nostoc]|uniref:Lipase family protein n=1 Tax=Nostoc paludosum FACHB-159 TaxID=2692908 RepID=A0ABR8KFX2_9NOSO|nr:MULTISPECIES: lipase family protein [Nostoc]MBD2681280.1 lipase family protein [Nostoc sp. FACHB-857]MBD2737759.1 lipase family protein [Nostoc paludosum FACHB-159]